jgi:putative DNA primase/helicase
MESTKTKVERNGHAQVNAPLDCDDDPPLTLPTECEPSIEEPDVLREERARERADRGYNYEAVKDKATEPQPEAGKEEEQKPEIRTTDRGNGLRLVERYREVIRYCHPWKSWLVWDGKRWKPDDTAEAVRLAKETLDHYIRKSLKDIATFTKAIQEAGDDTKHILQKNRDAAQAELAWLIKSEDSTKMNHMLFMAQSELPIPILPGDFDRNPWLLNVANGTIDLKTGTLLPHRREDLITKISPVEYLPDSPCPLLEKFLWRIMDGNQDLITYLQRAVGYSLTADVSEQCLFFLHGAGCNGKSTFLKIILWMMGDYGLQTVSDLLLAKNSEAHPTERADLFQMRFATTIETEEGKKMAESLMKQLTGGDRLRARKCFKDFFEFDQTWKLWLAANHKPTVRGTDLAVWRRIKLTPFTVTITDQEKDKNLDAKLKKELPGILAWSVRGCIDWQKTGLQEPEEVKQATDSYRAEQDTIGKFIDECCFVNPEVRYRNGDMFDAYQKFSGDKQMTEPAFNDRLRARGFESKRGTGGYYFWHGIALQEMKNQPS